MAKLYYARKSPFFFKYLSTKSKILGNMNNFKSSFTTTHIVSYLTLKIELGAIFKKYAIK